MPNLRSSSTLYRLIEAAQLVRRALLVPLAERGLEAGDDAVLFLLEADAGTADVDLAADLGLPPEALATRLDRLGAHGLVEPRATGPDLAPGFALTEAGIAFRDLLAESWEELESALVGDMGKERRKLLRRSLRRLIDLLSLQTLR